jgi:hypothetical protein
MLQAAELACTTGGRTSSGDDSGVVGVLPQLLLATKQWVSVRQQLIKISINCNSIDRRIVLVCNVSNNAGISFPTGAHDRLRLRVALRWLMTRLPTHVATKH